MKLHVASKSTLTMQYWLFGGSQTVLTGATVALLNKPPTQHEFTLAERWDFIILQLSDLQQWVNSPEIGSKPGSHTLAHDCLETNEFLTVFKY